MQKAWRVPRQTLLGQREEIVDQLQPDRGRRGPERQPGGAVQSQSPPRPARNAFVPLKTLQDKLGVARRVNALLASDRTKDLQARLDQDLRLDDSGLNVIGPEQRTDELFGKLDRTGDKKLYSANGDAGSPRLSSRRSTRTRTAR